MYELLDRLIKMYSLYFDDDYFYCYNCYIKNCKIKGYKCIMITINGNGYV